MSTRPRKQIILAAYFGGVNEHTAWEHPDAGSQIDFDTFRHVAQTAERGRFDYFFLAEGLRAARARRPGVRARHRRPARHPPGARRAGGRHRAHRPRRHAQRDLQRAVRAGPPARDPRPPLGRPRRLERRDELGRLHGAELPPRRLPRPRGPVHARRGVREHRPGAVGLVGGRRRRRRQGERAVPGGRRRRGVRAHRPAVRHRRPLHRAAQPAGAPGHRAGRDLAAGPRLRGGELRPDLLAVLEAGRGAGVLRRRQGARPRARPKPRRPEDHPGRRLRARGLADRMPKRRPGTSSSSSSATAAVQVLLEQLWNRDLSAYDIDGPLPDIEPDPDGPPIIQGQRVHLPGPVRDRAPLACAGRGEGSQHPRRRRRGLARAPSSSARRSRSPTRWTTSSRTTARTASCSAATSPRAASTSSSTRSCRCCRSAGRCAPSTTGSTLRENLGLPIPERRGALAATV